jgi:hypothetical protein
MRVFELLEALSQNQAKYYLKQWNEAWSDEIYEPLFGTKWRIYIPLLISDNQEELPVYSNVRMRVKKHLQSLGYSIKSYNSNLAVDERGRERKIGKLLSPELLKDYQEDPVRAGSTIEKNVNKYQIVISRHPYDVAGMSTDRGWKSCMTLTHTDRKTGEEVEAGCNQHIVEEDVKAGTLIAYLIAAGDRNIENPIARILIKPFYNEDEGLLLSIEGSNVYGNAPLIFKDSVGNWVDQSNDILESLPGSYRLPSNLYYDLDDGEEDHGGYSSIEYAGSTAEKEKRKNQTKKTHLTNSVRLIFNDIKDPLLRADALEELFGSPMSYEIFKFCVDVIPMLSPDDINVSDDVLIQYINDTPFSISAGNRFKNSSIAVKRAFITSTMSYINQVYSKITYPQCMLELMTTNELYKYIVAGPEVRISDTINEGITIPFTLYVHLARNHPLISKFFKLSSEEWKKLIELVPSVLEYKEFK